MQATDHLSSKTFSQYCAAPVIDPDSGKFLEYQHLIQVSDKDIWKRYFPSNIDLLVQSVGTCMTIGNDTIFFIHPSEIPLHKKVTYRHLVVDIYTLEEEKFRVRLMVGGN